MARLRRRRSTMPAAFKVQIKNKRGKWVNPGGRNNGAAAVAVGAAAVGGYGAYRGAMAARNRRRARRRPRRDSRGKFR